MNKLKDIKIVAFDYGGTLDLPGMHWFDFLWDLVTTQLHSYLPVTREAFWDAYVYGERELESHPVPSDAGLYHTLLLKSNYELDYLQKNVPGLPLSGEQEKQHVASLLATAAVKAITEGTYKESAKVLTALHEKYQLYIVSNYYGNLRTVLADADFLRYITFLIDSTVVGIRKPDPAIWKLAVDAAGVKPEHILVVGDSMKNDILPAQSLGCRTAWLTKEAPDDYEGLVIHTLTDLLLLL